MCDFTTIKIRVTCENVPMVTLNTHMHARTLVHTQTHTHTHMHTRTHAHAHTHNTHTHTHTASGCGRLKPPDNGDVQLTGTTIGSSATYSCSEGFNLEGDNIRVCQESGEWSGVEPVCSSESSISMKRLDGSYCKEPYSILIAMFDRNESA